MPQEQQSLSFLEQFIEDMLKQTSIGELSEKNKKTYLDQFVAEAQVRLGVALLPRLTEEHTEQFTALLEKETAPEEWDTFWKQAVPDFTEVITKTMRDFATEVQTILNK